MTQTPPVSPDFATPPKELVDRAKAWRTYTKDGEPIGLTSDEVVAFAHELLAAEERGASRERERADKLRKALEQIAQVGDGYGPRNPCSGTTGEGHARCLQIADAALAEKDKTP